MRNSVANKIFEYADKHKELFLIAGDAGLGVWDEFKVKYPKQYINPGVNEQFDIGFAAGLALRGHKVIFYNITPFVIMRPYEQVRNDICYQELPVILIGTGSGITYAPAGVTHYAVEDIAIARTLPNLEIFSPADPVEAVESFKYAFVKKKPSFIRIPKSGEPILHKGKNIDITEPQLLQKGKDAVIFLHSSIVEEKDILLEILSAKGINPSIYTVPLLTTNFDFSKIIKDYEYVFVWEEHFETGGFGSILLEKLNNEGFYKKIYKIALPNEYIHKIGNRNFLREFYKIDGKSAAKKIIEITNQKNNI